MGGKSDDIANHVLHNVSLCELTHHDLGHLVVMNIDSLLASRLLLLKVLLLVLEVHLALSWVWLVVLIEMI